MKFYLAGSWQDRDAKMPVFNPANQQVIDTVPVADATDVDKAIEDLVSGAKIMEALPGYDRFLVLRRAADLMLQRQDDLARMLSCEEGKTLAESRFEVERAAQTLELSGEEAKRLSGEVLPLDGGAGVRNKLGFTLRIPCGVVAAITPFNFPLNLVCHKVGPGLAAGNAVLLKPASDTPLSALSLIEILLEAGLPERAIACLTGKGSELGSAICRDPRVRKISFTGSQDVGESICQMAGLKRVTMELGSNCPLVVLPDADIEKVVSATVSNGFSNAGQVCISAQRMIVTEPVLDEFMQALLPQVKALVVGEPLDSASQMGPMVREGDATRVRDWLHEAVAEGGKLLCGGESDGAFMEPSIIMDANPQMRIVREELFGPALAVLKVPDIDEAIRLANDSKFGLSAGVFTQDLDAAVRFAREVQCGNVHINSGPMWRTDLMPYGGLKDSGLGREGPKYAIEEMTEMKSVVIHS